MENLCTDILENILFRIPVDAAIQAKRVCTTWRAIIRNKTEKTGFLFPRIANNYHPLRFTEKQLFYQDKYDDHSKLIKYFFDKRFIDHETANSMFHKESVPKHVMVGSCNGLVCFGRYYMESIDPFLVCNPFTTESACLPEFNSSGLPEDIASTRKPYGRLISGFGYCPSTNDYKAVSILYPKEEEEGGYVQVYTLGSWKWRYVGHTGHRCIFNYSSGIYTNGALFWLHRRSTRRVKESEIVAFDLEGEKFHYIALPRCKDFEYIAYNTPINLLVGNNKLYLVHTYYGASRADVWVYKRNINNNRDTISSHWLMEFSLQLDFPTCFKPLAITRSSSLLWYDWINGRLNWYDPKNSTSNKLPYGNEHAIPHTRSVVSLKDLGETNVTSYKDLKKMKLAAMELLKSRRKRQRRILNHTNQN